MYGGIAMHLWKERLRGELNLCPQISEREESRLKSPHVMFLPSYFVLRLYISVSNVVVKSHRDLSCAKVLWVDGAAPLLFLRGSLCDCVELDNPRWLPSRARQVVLLLYGCLHGGFPNVVGWIGFLS